MKVLPEVLQQLLIFKYFFNIHQLGRKKLSFFQDQSSHPDSIVFNDRRIQGSTEETLSVRSLHVLQEIWHICCSSSIKIQRQRYLPSQRQRDLYDLTNQWLGHSECAEYSSPASGSTFSYNDLGISSVFYVKSPYKFQMISTPFRWNMHSVSYEFGSVRKVFPMQ